MKWKGQQEKPITMTEYYEESKKVSNLGNKQASNIGRNYVTNERIRSFSPSSTRGKGLTDVQQIKAAKPHIEATMTTKTYETKATTQYPINKSSNTVHNYQQQQQQQHHQHQQQHQQQTINNSSILNTDSNYQSSLKQNLNQQQQEKRTIQSGYNQQQTRQSSQQTQSRQASRASNATHELDDLMANLDDFKVTDNQRESKTTTQFKTTQNVVKGQHDLQTLLDAPEYASVTRKSTQRQDDSSINQRSTITSSRQQGGVTENRTTTATKEIRNLGNLENIIGSIEIEMNKQGLESLAKGSCFSCKKAIVGQVITALGRSYHPEHFVCAYCKQELGERTFFERDGECFCETDYHNLFAPKCNYCSEPITGRQKCVSALNTTFHADHFFCAECNIQFTEDKGYHEHNNQAYCSDCYLNIFAPKCIDCGMVEIKHFK